MKEPPQQFTRMSGTDQIVWNLVNDQDLFCIWAMASLTEPLQDGLIEKALNYLIQTIPILNARPVTTWFAGKWQFLPPEDVAQLISRVQTTNNNETEEQVQKVFTTPINARKGAMIRLHSLDGPERHYLVIQVHHLVVDGEGLKRICAQFAEIYRALYQDPDWQPDQMLDPCRSLGQILYQARPFRLLTALPASLGLLAKTPWNLRQMKEGYRLIHTAGPAPLPSRQPYFSSISLTQENMQAATVFTRRRQTTIHALLMTSFSLATVAWNTRRGDERNRLSFFHTANLRRWWGEPSGTFANFSVVVWHKEDIANLHSPSLALITTTAKLEQAKNGLGLMPFSSACFFLPCPTSLSGVLPSTSRKRPWILSAIIRA